MADKTFLVTTTGTPATVVVDDLAGLTLVHPIVSKDLLAEYDRSELFNSVDLQAAITGAEITVEDEAGNAITSVKDFLFADGVGYDNTISGLTATDVKAAIDELSTGIVEEVYSESFGRDKVNASGIWLDRVGGMPSNLSPFKVPYTGQLVRIVSATRDLESYDAEVYIQPDVRAGGIPTDGNKLAELVVAAASSGDSGVLSVAVTAGDDIGVYLRGTGISFPTVTLIFKR